MLHTQSYNGITELVSIRRQLAVTEAADERFFRKAVFFVRQESSHIYTDCQLYLCYCKIYLTSCQEKAILETTLVSLYLG